MSLDFNPSVVLIQNKADRILSSVVAFIFLSTSCKFILFNMFGLLEAYNDDANILLSIILIILFFLCGSYYSQKTWVVFLISTILLIFNGAVAFFLFPQNIEYIILDLPRITILGTMPMALLFSINDFKILYEKLVSASYIIITVCLLQFMQFVTSLQPAWDYYMPFSYYCLFPTLVLLNYFIIRKRIIDLFLSFAGLLLIIFLGARGPLLCILGYMVLLLLHFTIARFQGTKIIKVFGMLLAFLLLMLVAELVFSTNSITFVLIEFADYFDVSSRTLALIEKASFFELSGREYIYQETWEAIHKSPIVGWGMRGDAVYLNGGYSHNYLLEMFANFGIVAGSIFLLYTILLIGYALLTNNNQYLNNLILIFFSTSIIKLQFSSSFWIEPSFWVFNGLGIIYAGRVGRF